MNIKAAYAPESLQVEDIAMQRQERVEIVSIIVNDDDTRAKIQSFFESKKALIEYCYRAKTRKLTAAIPQGKILLDLIISGDGRVKEIKLKLDSLTDSDITDCLIEKMGRLKIPGISKENTISVEIEIEFIQ
jgi:hypothetical protein